MAPAGPAACTGPSERSDAGRVARRASAVAAALTLWSPRCSSGCPWLGGSRVPSARYGGSCSRRGRRSSRPGSDRRGDASGDGRLPQCLLGALRGRLARDQGARVSPAPHLLAPHGERRLVARRGVDARGRGGGWVVVLALPTAARSGAAVPEAPLGTKVAMTPGRLPSRLDLAAYQRRVRETTLGSHACRPLRRGGLLDARAPSTPDGERR